MSMYVVNRLLKMNWILRNTLIDIPLASFDIRIRPPIESGRGVTYINSAIAVEDYVAPTVTSDGWASYSFTPDIEGLWELVLTDGDENENTFYYEKMLEVQSPDTHIRKVVDGNLI